MEARHKYEVQKSNAQLRPGRHAPDLPGFMNTDLPGPSSRRLTTIHLYISSPPVYTFYDFIGFPDSVPFIAMSTWMTLTQNVVLIESLFYVY